MEELRFSETELLSELERLTAAHRIVFAAACAERLAPAFADYSHRTGRADATVLESILERLWLDVQGRTLNSQQLQEDLDTSMSLIPEDESGPWVVERARAEDATAAVAYALRCRQNGLPQEAAWAARRTYEASDQFVISQLALNMNKPGAEELVLSHPLVQAELFRQRRDLDELLTDTQRVDAGLAKRMRERARDEAQRVFGSKIQ